MDGGAGQDKRRETAGRWGNPPAGQEGAGRAMRPGCRIQTYVISGNLEWIVKYYRIFLKKKLKSTRVLAVEN